MSTTRTELDDSRYMARAIELARRGLRSTDPNPRVGCVVVADGEIVGEGWHERAGEPHAEVHALDAAGERARGATVYVTLEPCSHHGRTPPCADALVRAQVARVVVAAGDPNPRVAGGGLARLREAGIEVSEGLLAGEAHRLNPGFDKRMQQGLPWVRCKLAMSLDGRTAMSSGESKWITGEQARGDVQSWRARSSAIVTGIGTVLADDPRLDVRVPGASRQPARVVFDSTLRMPPGARMLRQPGRTIVLGAEDAGQGARAALEQAGAEVVLLPRAANGIDPGAALRLLAGMEINEVLVEAGPVLAGSLLQSGLVDELLIYMAPHLMGDAARGLFRMPGLVHMDQRVELEIDDVRAVGSDWRITARPRVTVGAA